MNPSSPKTNYAFIDAQNLNAGLSRLGWKLDWKKFRTYLAEERNVEVAYIFLGFMPDNQDLYLVLQKSGFVVVFKEILTTKDGDVKGNVDAELILQAMVDYDRYARALIVSGDGDFTCLLRYLAQNDKLEWVLAPFEKSLSSLIQRAAEGKIEHLRSLRRKIEYRYGMPIKKTEKPERIPFVPEQLAEGKEIINDRREQEAKKEQGTRTGGRGNGGSERKKENTTTKTSSSKPVVPPPIKPDTEQKTEAKHRPSRRRRGGKRVHSSSVAKKEDGQYDGFWEM